MQKKYFGASIHETNKPKKENPAVCSFLSHFPSTTPAFDPKGQDALVCVIVFLKGFQDTQSCVFPPCTSSMK